MTQRNGWEPIWKQHEVAIPTRFRSNAAPNTTIVAWARTLRPGSAILDVGCGVGRHCVYLGKQGFGVAGCDISPSGVERAIAACHDRGVTLDGRVCDMAALPWGAATFDGALSTSSIHHHLRADVQRALDEVWRVLKPGGLALLDFPTTAGLDYALLRAEVDAGHYREPEPNTFIDPRPEPRDVDGDLPHHFSDAADLRDLLRHFTILSMREMMRPARQTRGPGLVGNWVASVRKPRD